MDSAISALLAEDLCFCDGNSAMHLIREQYLSVVPRLLRIGYRKAWKRYKGNHVRAHCQFWAIAEAVRSVMREVEYEGQRFRLSYGRNQATCQQIETDSDWY